MRYTWRYFDNWKIFFVKSIFFAVINLHPKKIYAIIQSDPLFSHTSPMCKKYLKKLSATVLSCLQIATILPISLFTLMIPQETFADNTAFCATVTDVPASECIVLLDFYDAAN